MSLGHALLASPKLFELILLLISVSAGVFGAILGLGGGVIIVPALTLIFGIHIRYAIGASIVSVIATSSGAAATYVRDRITNIRVAMVLEVATVIGALFGASISTRIDPSHLYGLFAAMLIVSAWLMYRKKPKGLRLAVAEKGSWAEKLRLNSSYPDFQLKKEVSYGVTNVPLGFVLMIGAGVISGLLGVGSGALKVPAMDTAMSLPIKVSSATSNFMIGVTAAASAGPSYMRGNIVPFLAAPVALGVLLGSYLGAKIMMRLRNKRIRSLFIVVLLLVSLEMALRAFGIEMEMGR
ncbi:MAG: sulfite exporter TauE/SafE family protein [Methylotenera sp.]|nr:sulfite exporter TauE/SafE family protein [Oligoflexia bacterium]